LKRYYWLRLKEGFFEERAPACLRGMPEGETLLIIYIKMLLRGIRSDGMFQYSGTYPSNTDEIAAQIQEDPKLVRIAVVALERLGAIDVLENEDIYMLQLPTMIGTETDSAHRMRELREREKCLPNSDVRHIVTESDADVTQRES
jgi:predicted phage replisome organizer